MTNSRDNQKEFPFRTGFTWSVLVLWLVVLSTVALLMLFVYEPDKESDLTDDPEKTARTELSPSIFYQGAGTPLVAFNLKTLSELQNEKMKSYIVNHTYKPTGIDEALLLLKERKVGYIMVNRPMTEDQLFSLDCFQFPGQLNGVGIVVNLPRIQTGELRLSRQNLVEIFSGKILNWNDRRIGNDNPDLILPNLPITVVHRKYESDVDFVLANYLAAISPEWAKSVGTGPGINWPVGLKVNEGYNLGTRLETIAGSISYCDADYAVKYKLSLAKIQNKAGNYVLPTRKNIEPTIADLDEKDFLNFPKTLANLDNPECYPIVAITYTIIQLVYHPTFQQKEQIASFWDVVNWSMDQNATLEKLGYSSLFLPQRFRQKTYEMYQTKTADNTP